MCLLPQLRCIAVEDSYSLEAKSTSLHAFLEEGTFRSMVYM